ncbi:MAG TPA: plastocyanin/azurin family copper-binding protein [Anaerolineales bacterium]
MHNPSRSIFISLILVLICATLVACQRPTEALPEVEPVPGISLTLTGDSCPSVTLNAGDQITWTNQDSQQHHIRVETLDGQLVFEATDLQPGDSASLSFPVAGSYVYTCTPDEVLTGTITVEP